MGLTGKQHTNTPVKNNTREFWVIVSDLDGSLLDHHTYSPEAAKPALNRLRDLNLPLVLNTSKTLQETLDIAKSLGIRSPIVVENGGGIFVPTQTTAGNFWTSANENPIQKEWVPLGIPRSNILDVLKNLKNQRKLQFTSFAEMTLQELCDHTGLSGSSAEAAKCRNFSEPLSWHDTPQNFDWFRAELMKKNLRIVKGGRFHLVSGRHDKGDGLDWIRAYFKSEADAKVKMIAIGDGMNDLPMLEAADIAICVRSPVNPPLHSDRQKIIVTKSNGSEGWNESIIQTLQQINRI